VLVKQRQKEVVKVKASLEIDPLGIFKMEVRRDDENIWAGAQLFEKDYKYEEFIKKHARDGYITVVMSLEISKDQKGIKPAKEKLKESLARDVGRLLGEVRTSDYVVECQGKQFARPLTASSFRWNIQIYRIIYRVEPACGLAVRLPLRRPRRQVLHLRRRPLF
jgi:hypothetical protein